MDVNVVVLLPLIRNWLLYAVIAWISSFFILNSIRRSKLNPKRLPPGPFPLPLVGNILSVGFQPHKSLANLVETYGPVMTIQLGFQTTIVVSSPSMAKEVLQTNDVSFSNRFVPDAMAAHHEFSVGLRPPDARWRMYRRICTAHVFANSKLDATRTLRNKIIQDLLSYVQTRCKFGKPVNIGPAVFTTSLNLLSNTIFSINLGDPDSPMAREFREYTTSFAALFETPNLVDLFPVLKPVDPQGLRHRTTATIGKILNIFNDIITERLEARKSTVNGLGGLKDDDVLDALLSLTQDSHEFQLIDLQYLLLDLFGAGTETTSTVIEWAMAELFRNPQKMKNAQVELEEIIGNRQFLEEEDVVKLPYLRAVVMEVLRMHPPLPLLLPRKVCKDATLQGFTIPKNTQVIINAYAIGRESSVWPNPNSFEPERFLESSFDFKGHNFELIPFGAGRRICLGLPLVSRILYTVLGSLIHSFNWVLEDGMNYETLDMEEKFGITLHKVKPLYATPMPK